MATCLVTGGSGFLGSHLCDELLARGHRVICVDNFETGSLANIHHLRGPEFTFLHADVTQPFFVDEPVDFVYHFASPASPIDYLRLPLHTLKVGSYGTHNALGLAKLHRARFLTASTSEVYGDPQVHPQPESYWGHVNPIGPRGVYDEAKRYAEALTMAYHRQQGVDTAIVRIFNTYGPRMRPHDGRAIPTFLRQALQDRPITVFGDGSQTRSFCLRQRPDRRDHPARRVRATTSRSTSAIRTSSRCSSSRKAVIEVTGSRSEIVFEALPTDDPQVRQPDISLARELLGWEPTVELREGLRRTLDAAGVRRRCTGALCPAPCESRDKARDTQPVSGVEEQSQWPTPRPRSPSAHAALARPRASPSCCRPSTSAASARRRSRSCCGWRRCAGPRASLSLLALDFAGLFARARRRADGQGRASATACGRGTRPFDGGAAARSRSPTWSRCCCSRARACTPSARSGPGCARIVSLAVPGRRVVALIFALVNGEEYSSYYIFYGTLVFAIVIIGSARAGRYERVTGALLRAAGYRRRAVLVGSGRHIEDVAHALTRRGARAGRDGRLHLAHAAAGQRPALARADRGARRGARRLPRPGGDHRRPRLPAGARGRARGHRATSAA